MQKKQFVDALADLNVALQLDTTFIKVLRNLVVYPYQCL